MSSLAETLAGPALLVLLAMLFAYCVWKARLVRDDVATIGSLLEHIPHSARNPSEPPSRLRKADRIDPAAQVTVREFRI
ncbi:hypothetical protein ABVV53_12775 [Novosphingobium sp. RD2P27]|uniref:Uncharacterized protein n=1 Tax=Novosphingobium kalidii TaxID=3230299 RepID=A0ABV2D364_9SPHN